MDIKFLCFDLDGVLVDTSEIHFKALNMALESFDPSYIISKDFDSQVLGTIPTREKILLIAKEKNIPSNLLDSILLLKKQLTEQLIEETSVEELTSTNVFDFLDHLKNQNYQMVITSNTNQDFITKVLTKCNLISFFNKIYSNSNIAINKPHPNIYWQAMIEAKVDPYQTLIFEDSSSGQAAASLSNAHLFPIEKTTDLKIENFQNFINKPNKPFKFPKWKSVKTNVLIPMAGAGSRFAKVGYKMPKPLIDVMGMPMIKWVVDYLNIEANFIYLVQKEHYEKYYLETILNLITPNCQIVQVDGLTEGAACTVLKAKDLIDNDNQLIIANSDQIWEWDANSFYYQMTREDIDGGVITFIDESMNPKWSFAKLDQSGFITEIQEKKPISNIATAGIYHFKKGSDYVKYANQMINKNIRVNNEFYVAPVYNEAILENKKFKIYHCDRMIGLGTPEDLDIFLAEKKNEQK